MLYDGLKRAWQQTRKLRNSIRNYVQDVEEDNHLILWFRYPAVLLASVPPHGVLELHLNY
ncbi:hypothetical protein LEP1GSC085_2350 [Leptospira interrogans str. L0996]|nr:hypothetical protein LEP1GSC085_2350 [Leptospira interrogans str. L0996]